MGGGEDDYTLIFRELFDFFFYTADFPKELSQSFVCVFWHFKKNRCIILSTLMTTRHQIFIKGTNHMIKNYLEKLVLILEKLLFLQ